MKQFQLFVIMAIFFFSSCGLTEFEISLGPTMDFEGNYKTKLECDDILEDVFRRNMEISITKSIGSLYVIEIDEREKLIASRKGSKLILEDQEIDKMFSNENLILNGEISKSSFDDLDFEFVVTYKSGNEEDCLLELKSDS